MKPMRTMVLVWLSAAGVVAFAPRSASNTDLRSWRHTHLVKSYPTENDTLATPPKALRLWFSEPVELAVTSVKLANAAGTPIALDPVARPDTGKNAPVVAAVKNSLPAGDYVVSWSTAALDGHPAKGTIAFVVKSPR
jgi:methionine-rich copper-binding protein CopC